jgi:hypothetical protein
MTATALERVAPSRRREIVAGRARDCHGDMTMLVADHERASGCPHFRIVNPYVRARTVFLLLLKLGSFQVLIRRSPSDAGPVPPTSAAKPSGDRVTPWAFCADYAH